MKTPAIADLPDEFGRAAISIARRLREHGFQGWLVGGAVRDLVLGRPTKDVDIATDARPEDIERLFGDVKGVGRAFGTMIVFAAGVPAQVTTFRSERGYSDARRPDAVEFGSTVEEDSRRRDFTCNALYLDPIDGTCLDPQGGLGDLGARRLRAIGEPRERFREDGLRLLRLARFAADLDLEVDPATLAGARESVGSFVGVSGERVLGELQAMARRQRPARALELLGEIGLVERVVPWVASADLERRCAVLRALAAPVVGDTLFFAALVLDEVLESPKATTRRGVEARLVHLRPSRELSDDVGEVGELLNEFGRWLAEPPRRSALVRTGRSRTLGLATHLARACGNLDFARLEPFLERIASFSPDELHPRPLLTAQDLEAAGIPKGRRWRELLDAAAAAQLELELTTREAALLWLRERA